jgi:solute carrier family 35 protein F5
MGTKDLDSKAWKWGLGLIYIIAVAIIWIAASFVVQSVVDAGVSPFLVTYICNSLFVVLIPIVEIGRYLENSYGGLWFWKSDKSKPCLEGKLGESEQAILLRDNDASGEVVESVVIEEVDVIQDRNIGSELLPSDDVVEGLVGQVGLIENVDQRGLDEKGRWTRCRVAKVSLLICPFWFFAQLTFNLSLKYTTVTVSEFGFFFFTFKFCFISLFSLS